MTTFAYDLDTRTVQKLPLQVNMRDLIRRKPPKGVQTSVRVTFSPDAQSLLAMVTQRGEKRYWVRGVVFPLTGGLPRELFTLSSTDREGELPLSIAWSPDSERVVVLTLRGTEKDREETALRLRVLRVDGGAQRVIDLS